MDNRLDRRFQNLPITWAEKAELMIRRKRANHHEGQR